MKWLKPLRYDDDGTVKVQIRDQIYLYTGVPKPAHKKFLDILQHNQYDALSHLEIYADKVIRED